MPKKFYLIAHNPNSVDQAAMCLQSGANALEPDVYFEKGSFYVMEIKPVISSIFPPKKGPLLQDYLQQLQAKLNANDPQKLALIMFDTKNFDQYDCRQLLDVIEKNFSNAFPDVAFSVTVGSKKYLRGFNNYSPAPFAAGIDAGCEAKDANDFFAGLRLKYTFACGISLPVISTTGPAYLNKIKNAIAIRNTPDGKYLKLIYAWTVNSKSSMRTYLRLDIDGLITDNIADLLAVMNEDEFKGKFEMAHRGDNPFQPNE